MSLTTTTFSESDLLADLAANPVSERYMMTSLMIQAVMALPILTTIPPGCTSEPYNAQVMSGVSGRIVKEPVSGRELGRTVDCKEEIIRLTVGDAPAFTLNSQPTITAPVVVPTTGAGAAPQASVPGMTLQELIDSMPGVEVQPSRTSRQTEVDAVQHSSGEILRVPKESKQPKSTKTDAEKQVSCGDYLWKACRKLNFEDLIMFKPPRSFVWPSYFTKAHQVELMKCATAKGELTSLSFIPLIEAEKAVKEHGAEAYQRKAALRALQQAPPAAAAAAGMQTIAVPPARDAGKFHKESARHADKFHKELDCVFDTATRQ